MESAVDQLGIDGIASMMIIVSSVVIIVITIISIVITIVAITTTISSTLDHSKDDNDSSIFHNSGNNKKNQ